MLRITTSETQDLLLLKLEGRVTGPWVNELRQTWLGTASAFGSKAVHVDLSAVSFADANGCELLRQIRKAGAMLLGGSGFLRQILWEAGKKPERSGQRQTEDFDERTIRF
jgi:anti-anti-sigma regulatory factor